MSDATYTVYCDGSSECICINIEFPAQEPKAPWTHEELAKRTTVGAEIWLRSREAAEDLLQQIKEATAVVSDKAEYMSMLVAVAQSTLRWSLPNGSTCRIFCRMQSLMFMMVVRYLLWSVEHESDCIR